MIWQPEVPTIRLGNPLDHQKEWQQAFIAGWYALSEGFADLQQTADFANELYATQGARNPVEVAREEWDTSA